MRVLLPPNVRFPNRVPGGCRLRLDPDRGIVTIIAVLPCEMRPPHERSRFHSFKVLLGALMFGGFLFAALVYTTAPRISDWEVRDTAQPVAGAHATDDSCSTKLILAICDATLAVRTPSGTLSRRVNYAFMGVQLGDYTVRVMVDLARPDLATTDLALDKLWNRTITLIVDILGLLALTIGAPIAMIKKRRCEHRQLRQTATL